MQEKIKNLIKKYDRQLSRSEKKEKELEERKDRLSVHGYWDLGYFAGRSSLYADIRDDLNDLLL